jgi:hypothetical protein
MSRSVNRESDKAGAQQDKAGNGYSEEAVGSEFFTHGSPPVVCPCPTQHDRPDAQSKKFPLGWPFRFQLMISSNTREARKSA